MESDEYNVIKYNIRTDSFVSASLFQLKIQIERINVRFLMNRILTVVNSTQSYKPKYYKKTISR